MALSSVPVITTGAVVAAAGTSVVPAVAIPENCHTVVIQNVGAAVGLFGIAGPGGALVERVSACRLPVGASVTLGIGPASSRGVMDQAQVASSGLVYDSLFDGTTFDIIYLTAAGSGTGLGSA